VFEKIKRLTIIAMFSDNYLMEKLVLKGGNLIDLIFKIQSRASFDLDFSICDDFEETELPAIEDKIKTLLIDTFASEGFTVFDINFTKEPLIKHPFLPDLWGSYIIEFNVIETYRYHLYISGDSNVVMYSPKIDISKREYCDAKDETIFDNYVIYIYTPAMVVFEKLRAICQQMRECEEVCFITSDRKPRPRDFYDIHSVMQHFPIDIKSEDSAKLITAIFYAKAVPLDFIGLIVNYREFHRQGFQSLAATVRVSGELKYFDFYFDFVLSICEELKPIWVK